MNLGDAQYIRPGDTVILKHNLGRGEVINIATHAREAAQLGLSNTCVAQYPMILFRQDITRTEHWCTYLAVARYIPNPQGD